MTKTQESPAEVVSATDPTDTDPNEEAPADDPIHDVA